VAVPQIVTLLALGILVGPDGLIRVHDPSNARLSLFHPETGFVRSERIPVLGWGFLWDAVMDEDGFRDPVEERRRRDVPPELRSVLRRAVLLDQTWQDLPAKLNVDELIRK
jgi:hypothetical protein